MSNQLLIEQYRVYDANGFPVPEALLYTYVPGTTTPRTVYTDSALSVAASNPVVADASGTFPPLYSVLPVKINVTDASGNAVPGYPRDHAVLGVDPDDFTVSDMEVTGTLAAAAATVDGSDVYTKANILGPVTYTTENTGGVFQTIGIDFSSGYAELRASGWFTLIIRANATSGALTTVNFPSGLVAVDTDYAISPMADLSAARIATYQNKTTTSFQFKGFNDAGADTVNTAFDFTVTGRWRA